MQYCDGFCHTSAWISHRKSYVPFLLNFPPTFPMGSLSSDNSHLELKIYSINYFITSSIKTCVHYISFFNLVKWGPTLPSSWVIYIIWAWSEYMCVYVHDYYLNVHLMQELTHLKRPWCWERLRAGGERDDTGWDGWMASPIQWTWVWVDSGSWWWTGRPGMLWFMGSQRVGHNWATELNWTDVECYEKLYY